MLLRRYHKEVIKDEIKVEEKEEIKEVIKDEIKVEETPKKSNKKVGDK